MTRRRCRRTPAFQRHAPTDFRFLRSSRFARHHRLFLRAGYFFDDIALKYFKRIPDALLQLLPGRRFRLVTGRFFSSLFSLSLRIYAA